MHGSVLNGLSHICHPAPSMSSTVIVCLLHVPPPPWCSPRFCSRSSALHHVHCTQCWAVHVSACYFGIWAALFCCCVQIMLAGMHSASSQRYVSGTVWNWLRRCSYWHPCSDWWMLSSLLMKYSSNITCEACAKRFRLIVVTIKFWFPDYWRCQQAWCQLGKLGRKLVDCVLQVMSVVSVSVDRHCEELSRILADFYQRHWGRRVQKLMQFEATSAFGIENWGSFGISCEELMFVGGRLLLDVCTYTNSLSVIILHVNLITCLSTLPPGVYHLPVNPSWRWLLITGLSTLPPGDCLSLACHSFLKVIITCLSTLPPGVNHLPVDHSSCVSSCFRAEHLEISGWGFYRLNAVPGTQSTVLKPSSELGPV